MRRGKWQRFSCYSNKTKPVEENVHTMITDLSTKSVLKVLPQWRTFPRVLPTRWRQNSTGTNWRHCYPMYSQAVTHLVQYAVTQASWNGRDSSVRPSVCPVDRQQQRRPAGLLLSSGACSRYRSVAAAAAARHTGRVNFGPTVWRRHVFVKGKV